MKFVQYKDGSCDLTFNEKEITLLKKNKKLHLSSTALRHFGNNLIKIVVEMNELLPEKDRIIKTYKNEVEVDND